MKCHYPPCDNTATHHIVAKCNFSHGQPHDHPWDTRVCREHLQECESVARELLKPPHYTVEVHSLAVPN